jgi:regulator of protease activity HflC (stomatin/prohibitin superfamily)
MMNLDAFGYEVLLQPFLYLVAVTAVLTALFKGSGKGEDKKYHLRPGAGRLSLMILAGAALVIPAIVVTPPGHRAAIYSLSGGVSPVERAEGVSLILPYVQTARMVNIRTQVFTDEAVYSQSADLQEITVHIAVNYHVQADQAAELYQRVGLDYATTIIQPAVLQLVKQEVGLVRAADFAINREPLARSIEGALRDQLAPFGVTVEYVNVEDAIFDPAFITAVKEKVIADEIADKERRLVLAETHKKEQVIVQAEAQEQKLLIEARGQKAAIEEVASALGFTIPEYLEWVKLGRWDGVLPSTLLSGDASNLLIAP